MKLAVLYKSITGHSTKIATAIAQALEAPMYKIDNKLKLNDIDSVIIVGGIYAGNSHESILKFAESISSEQIKNAIIITSSAKNSSGQDKLRAILEKKLNKTVAEHHLFGSFMFAKHGHPNEIEINIAITRVKDTIKTFK